MKIILIFLILIPTISYGTTNTKLVWSDEFNYTGLPDPEKWTFVSGDLKWSNDKQFYTKDRNAWVEDGILKITAKKESYHTNRYTSAMLRSRDKGDWTYGRVEVRARLPEGKGTHAAIWMKPTIEKYGQGFKSGEIDIMEAVGFEPERIYGGVHTEKFNLFKENSKGNNIVIKDAHKNYHVYAVDWNEERIDFYVDDVLYFSYLNEHNSEDTWPFNIDFFLYLNLAIGSDWASMKGIDDSIFPQTFEIDYVRVYKSEDYSGTNSYIKRNSKEVLLNPDFTMGRRDWDIYTLNDAVAKIEPDNSTELRVDIDKNSINSWDIGFYQRDFALKANKTYKLVFTVSSKITQTINFGLQSDLNYNYFFNETVDLNQGKNRYEYIIKLDKNEMDSRLIFNLGRCDSDIRFHEIHLIEE